MAPVRSSQRLRPRPRDHVNRHTLGIQRRQEVSKEEKNKYLEPKRYRLTRKNLRHLHEQEQSQDKDMTRTRKSPSSDESRSTTIITTDWQFGSRLSAKGVMYMQFETEPPSDYAEIKTALAKERDCSVSVPRGWRRLKRAKQGMALCGLSLKSNVITSILENHVPPSDDYQRWINEQWTEVDNVITTGLSNPKPGIFEAYLWLRYPPKAQEVFDELLISQYGYTMPTFAMELNEESDPDRAERQAAYDGAVMTHAALAVDTQMGKEEDDLYSKTKAITVTLNPREICVYANHAVKNQSTGRVDELCSSQYHAEHVTKRIVAYHQHCIEQISLKTEENWIKACTVINNAQAFALSLADSRVRDVEIYLEQEDLRFEKIKTEQTKLQAEARAKVAATMSAAVAVVARGG